MDNPKKIVSLVFLISWFSLYSSLLPAQTMWTKGNELIISGTDGNDKVEVRVENGRVYVEFWDKRQPQSWKYGKGGISQVKFYGNNGNDSFTTQKTDSHLAAKVYGGHGFDTATLWFLDGDHFVNSIESLYYPNFGGEPFTTMNAGGERRINWQDICQGQSPTCYLAGSLAAIAHSSELNGDHRYAYNIRYVGYNVNQRGQYNYQVCFYIPVIRGQEVTNLNTIENNWNKIERFNKRWVEIDFKEVKREVELTKEELERRDRLKPDPSPYANDLIPYVRSRTLLAWPSIIQRAFLKTFQSTYGGNEHVTSTVLTGKKPKYYRGVPNDDVIEKMEQALSKNAVRNKTTKPITIGGFTGENGKVGARRKPSERQEAGPGKDKSGHAFVVLEVIPERKEIIVFNPWGVPKKAEHDPTDTVIRVPYSELKNGMDWHQVTIFEPPQFYDRN
ncbi:hypothetical protein V6x_56980 [Gimesia chilikensis]|uniref:Uncharacterized protein n=1 Tax=Gimesia chilikensis TaxID=2605989 RepID=A0A517WL26_9PLAN|nr:hypothetical protein [Gimesia chilikensis]QDU05954.1 hypothetical protein V6x_56980 [Gimesia chilikensis]